MNPSTRHRAMEISLSVVLVLAYVGCLVALHIVMYGGPGTKHSEADCWSGEWVVRTEEAINTTLFVLSCLVGASITRPWRSGQRGGRVAGAIGISLAAMALWGVLYWSWTFNYWCGL